MLLCVFGRQQHLAGVSSDSGVVDDGNFWRFGWYFFGNVRGKTSNITVLLGADEAKSYNAPHLTKQKRLQFSTVGPIIAEYQ